MWSERITILFDHHTKSPFQSEVLNVLYWKCRPVLTNQYEALVLSVTYPSPWPRRGLRLGEELPPEDLVVVPGARLNSPPAKSPSLSSDGSFHWLSRDCCDWNAEECCCKPIKIINQNLKKKTVHISKPWGRKFLQRIIVIKLNTRDYFICNSQHGILTTALWKTQWL